MSEKNYIYLDEVGRVPHLALSDLFFSERAQKFQSRICEKLKNRLSEYKRTRNDSFEKFARALWFPSCYFIDGERGTGKTTCLNALRHALCLDSDASIYSLADIEPADMAEGENFFLCLLTHVMGVIKKEKKKFSCGEDEKRKALAELGQCLSAMAEGLQLISSSAKQLNGYEDAAMFIEKSMERSGSSAALREKFQRMADLLSEITGKESFLVTIDDADLNDCHCWNIVETIRKYMHSPRVFFLFAGDLQHYRLIVRERLMTSFSDKAFREDSLYNERRLQTLDEMETQYILKVFPLDNRMEMPVSEELFSEEYNVFLKKTRESKQGENLVVFLKNALQYMTEKWFLSSALSLIGKLPLRSMVHLVKSWHARLAAREKKAALLAGQMSDDLEKVVYHYLIENHIDSGDVKADVFLCVVNHVWRLQKGSAGAALSPLSGSVPQAIASLYLGAKVAAQVQSLNDKLTYLFRVFPYLPSGSAVTMDDSEYTAKVEGMINRSEETRYRYMKHGNFAYSLRGAHCTAAMIPNGDISSEFKASHLYANGVIRIDSQSIISGDGVFHKIDDLIKTVWKKSLEDDTSISQNDRAYYRYFIALNHALSCYIDDEKIWCCVSIYNLLSFMQECLNVCVVFDGKEAVAVLENLLAKKRTLPTAGRFVSKVVDGRIVWNNPVEVRWEGRELSTKYLAEISQKRYASELHQLAEEICAWAKRAKSFKKVTFPASYSMCWHDFLQFSTIDRGVLRASRRGKGKLFLGACFVRYLSDFLEIVHAHIDAGRSPKDVNMAEIIGDFPLCAPFLQYRKPESGDGWASVYESLQKATEIPIEETDDNTEEVLKAEKNVRKVSAIKKKPEA